MPDKETPLFSVVICDHDRKQYIKEAVKSVLMQNISRSMLEILVVKNYMDEDIDKYLLDNNIRSVFTNDVPLSRKMVRGIENSTGLYICFLDDDDLFAPGKLSRITNFIEKHKRLSFYHDSAIRINEAGNINSKTSSKYITPIELNNSLEIKRNIPRLLRYRMDWYASMMCISRDAVLHKIDALSYSSASADRLLFLIGISGGGVVVFDFEPNTYYRIHQSLTTTFLPFDDFMKKRTNFYKNSLNSFESTYSLFKKTYSEEILEMFLVHEKIMLAFTDINEKYNLVNMFYRSVRYSIKFRKIDILVWYILLKLKRIFGLPILKLYYVIMISQLIKASK
jgi:glycosyltransferase involved in cell wall biosynthesis